MLKKHCHGYKLFVTQKRQVKVIQNKTFAKSQNFMCTPQNHEITVSYEFRVMSYIKSKLKTDKPFS